jgi:thioredoxin-related protein
MQLHELRTHVLGLPQGERTLAGADAEGLHGCGNAWLGNEGAGRVRYNLNESATRFTPLLFPAMPRLSVFLWLLVVALVPPGVHAGGGLPPACDLKADAAQARAERKVIVLFFHSASCPFCREVEDTYLPMLLRENAQTPRFILRTVEVRSGQALTGWDGRETTQRDFARAQGVRLVPHLRFVGPDGEALAEDLIGLNPPDFYGGYLDGAIQTAFEKLRGRPGGR